jgi:hypothetical protein
MMKRRDGMERRKGITGTPGLMAVALIIAVSIAIFYVINIIPLANKIVGIKTEAAFSIIQGDRGTALASFLNSSDGSKTYAELLGERTAEGFDPGIDSKINKILDSISPQGRIAVYIDGKDDPVKDYNKAAVGTMYMSTLALPGGGTRLGRVGIS